MPEPRNHDSTAALGAAVAAADRAADGDSNDAEIDALRHALTLALTHWPELHHVGGPEPAGGDPSRPPAVADADTAAATSAALVALPHTGIRVPDPAVRVSSLRQLPTPDGVAYTATLLHGSTPVGTVHNDGDGGATTYHPVDESPFGRRRLGAFVTASRTGDGQPISEEYLLEELISEYEHTTQIATATRRGRNPLRLRAALDDEHLAGVYYTAQHATVAKVNTAAHRRALAADLGRTVAPGQWWQLWTGERWEDLTPAPPHTAQDHR